MDKSISSLKNLIKEVEGIKELNQILVPQLEEANAKIRELSSELKALQNNHTKITGHYVKEIEKK